MKRSWITALTLATVAGSGGAFAGVVAGSGDAPANAEPTAVANQAAFVVAGPPTTPARTISYQVGAAGTATLTAANGSLTIDSAMASAGWVVTTASGAGAHVDAQFTDGTELVSFGADLVGDAIVVSLTNVPAVAPVAEAAQPAVAQAPAQAYTTSQPQPAMPASTVAPAAVQPPTTSATTAPSGSGDDEHESDDHETESDDD